MANLTFIIHCVDGLIIATDTSFPVGQTPSYDVRQDIIQVSRHRAVVIHGLNRATPQQWFQDSAVRGIAGDGIATIAQQMQGALVARYGGAGTPVPQAPFGILVAGYFDDLADFFTVNFNPPQFAMIPFPHNVFAGAEDVARLLDAKFPPRSFTLDQATTYAAFLILQSCTAYPDILRPSMIAATITKDNGFQWESDERIKEALRVGVQIGRVLDRKATGLFAGDTIGGKNS